MEYSMENKKTENRKTVVISPYSRRLRNGKNNAKNYCFWPQLIDMLIKKGYDVIQLGVADEKKFSGAKEMKYNLKLKEIKSLVLSADLWISVDNFLPHFLAETKKPGIVLWGRSDPEIYGYPHNINLLKDKKYLREDQYNIWEAIEFDPTVFVPPAEVISYIK